MGWRGNFKEIGSTLSSSLKIREIVPAVKLPFAGTWQNLIDLRKLIQCNELFASEVSEIPSLLIFFI